MTRTEINRSRAFLYFAVLVAICELTWLGCGVKSAPIPPESARPERILDLQAASAKNGVRLTWSRPEKYAGGDKLTDLSGFTVSRAEADGAFQNVRDVPVTDQGRFQVQPTFTITDDATQVGKTYRYTVTSNTTDDYHSQPSNEVTILRKVPPPPPNPETFMLPTPTQLP
ncbi:MAG: hypothetical protein Q7S58_19705 [Candidatus Binatus sp.]|uniref:hypothetical protein n=1 Tax=Candidatus Binatus sp. TaxID=2811406 RepID=UPI0027219B52|nr:hypothetical protein [Candidatus Binatus sp.]MDO8434628.1 hypothetical protein [Candidatus Binatus sp.]